LELWEEAEGSQAEAEDLPPLRLVASEPMRMMILNIHKQVLASYSLILSTQE
jgi:hypothetical protein